MVDQSSFPSSSPAPAFTPATPSVAPGLPVDPLWPRAGSWAAPLGGEAVDVVIVGVPTSRTSISATNAHETPAAIRQALRRYSGHAVAPGTPGVRGEEAQLELSQVLSIRDAGDLADPDSVDGELAATAAIAALARDSRLVIALGGDNSLTVPAARGVLGAQLDSAALAAGAIGAGGLITLDAHHDLRDGRSNGSPVRRLVEAGLDPRRIVQIGIADFANSRAYRDRARDLGIRVIHRDELFDRPLREIVAEALAIAGDGEGPIHVDLDVDVCDRAVVPACPAAVPGGISAAELRRMTRLLARDARVASFDLAEIDATADSADGRTVRLAALLVLEAMTGLAERADPAG